MMHCSKSLSVSPLLFMLVLSAPLHGLKGSAGSPVDTQATSQPGLGSGPDVLELKVSEDAYRGDAQFTVAIDGRQIGGTQTATALHRGGTDQVIDIHGTYGIGSHTVTIDFLNDLYGGNAAADRNLYVDSASFNGILVPAAHLTLYRTGSQSFQFSAPESFAPSGRGGSLLPAGYLSTRGNQIVDEHGTPVRIASVGWYGTDGTAGSTLQGFYALQYGGAHYTDILQSIKDDGFNTVRIPWTNVNLNVLPGNTGPLGTLEMNPEFLTLTTIQMFQRIVDRAGQIGLKVIFDHHSDEGTNGQQHNGLWIDKGPGTFGTDGYSATDGVPGTVDSAKFLADWLQMAQTFAGNSTVIGFDLDNEPTTNGGATWGGDGPIDIHRMYQDVGNAVQAADPGALIICEGLIGGAPNYVADLLGVRKHPVVLHTPHKVVYSIHDYPLEISGNSIDSGLAGIQQNNVSWGFVEKEGLGPVWIGEMGSNMVTPDSQAWASTLLDYMNGKDGAQGGPTFTGNQQPVSGDWWNLGTEGGGGNPDGIQTAWGIGNYKPAQQVVTDQMLFRPKP